MGLLAPLVGRIYDRVGPRALLISGSTLVSLVLWGLTLLDEHSPSWWVLVAHVSLSIGLALVFTPLFTSSLGALTPDLYSHGSATVGTVQQVAGAAGSALFVTILTAREAVLAGQGANVAVSTAGGVHSAFLVGAIISIVAIPVSALIRRAPQTGGAPAPMGH